MAENENPTLTEEQEERTEYLTQIRAVASALRRASAVMVLSGAGMSVDSGLKTYTDIADVPAYRERDLEYRDLCDPELCQQDPALSWGFWGSCLEDYRSAVPHKGYDVLNKIRDYVLTKKDNQEFRQKMIDQYYALMKENVEEEEAAECMKEQEEPPTCYFSYTSNVDGLFLKSGLRSKELLEIHGSCLRFQCPEGSESNHPLVRVPESFHIELDPKTLLATNADCVPHCSVCKKTLRPNVYMFNDDDWQAKEGDFENYDIWEEAMEDVVCSQDDYSVMFLEIGCGMRVLSIKYESEAVLGDVLTHYIPTGVNTCKVARSDEFLKSKALLVRINVESAPYLDYYKTWNDSSVDYDFRKNIINIKGGAEQVLMDIYNELERLPN